MGNAVEVRREPPIRFVKLDTGPYNVLGLEAIRELAEAFAPDAEAPVVVLRGRSDGFCAGLDTKTLQAGGLDREELLAAMGELLVSTLSGPTRIVSLCEGHAVAAGAMLLLVSDLRLGIPGTHKLGFTEARLGMPLPTLPAILARQRLARRRLHELAVLGRTVEPEDARDAGFLDAVVETERIETRGEALARDLATLSDSAYLGSLRAVWGETLAMLWDQLEAQQWRREAARAKGD